MAIAAQQVVILYLIVAVGFAADRFGIFTQSTAKKSNDLLFYIITPVTIIKSFLTMQFSRETVNSLVTAFLCMSATIIVGILIAIPFFRKDKNGVIYKFGISYGNMGYMALPLCEAMLGSEGVFYCSIGMASFNIISFIHGVWLMTKGTQQKGFELKKIILNPGVIAVLIGLPLFITGVKLPSVCMSSITHISNLMTPLAMVFLGTYIANTDLKTIFKTPQNYLASFLKLVVLPVIMFLIFKLFGISGNLLTACVISAAAPSANNTVMFAAKYGKDTAVASKEVAFCSLFSVVTIPVMTALSYL